MRTHTATAAFLLFAMALDGCTTQPERDLARASQVPAADRQQVPVIIIPGMLGSRLFDRETGIEAWPGTKRKLLTSGYPELALQIDPSTLEPLDDGLVPGGLFDRAVVRDFYARIVRALQEVGYRQAQPGQPALRSEARLYIFTYDWRQDMVRSAQKLDGLIEQIRRDYGDPELRVDVVGHSMGGMIVRYYQRYGAADVLDGNAFLVTGAGARKLRRVTLIGTPNLGSVSAIHFFLDGYRVSLSRLVTEGVATMPAMYEFFPNPQVTWIANTRGEALDLDVFDVKVWRHLEWSVFSRDAQRRMASEPGIWPSPEVFERYFEKRLKRAQRFVWSLDVPTGGVELVRPLLLGGDCIPTAARLVLEEEDGDLVARRLPEQIRNPVPGVDYEKLMFEPGDSLVTASSVRGLREQVPPAPPHELAGTELENTFFVCTLHEQLSSNKQLLDHLLRFLLDPGGRTPAVQDQATPAPAT